MKIICIGRNYKDHIKEMNSPLPKVPLFFMKPNTSLLPKRNPFYYPNFTKNLHYECELVVKINRVGKNIAEKYAHEYYDHVGIGIDFTARDIQQKCKENGHPWEIAKSFENSAPVGEKFLPLEGKNIQNIDFRLEKNGEIVQKGNSKDMIFSVNYIISYLSQFFTLKIGDLIFTGTPNGVGPVQIDDVLEAYIGDERYLKLNIK